MLPWKINYLHSFWYLFAVIVCCVQIVSGSYGGHDLFTSLAELKELWINDIEVVQEMKKVVVLMKEIQDSMQRFVKFKLKVKLQKSRNLSTIAGTSIIMRPKSSTKNPISSTWDIH